MMIISYARYLFHVVGLSITVAVLSLMIGFGWGFSSSEERWVLYMDRTFTELTEANASLDTLEMEWEALDPFCKSCSIRHTYDWLIMDSITVTAVCDGSAEIEVDE